MKRSNVIPAAMLVAAMLLCGDGSTHAAVEIASGGTGEAIVVVSQNATAPEKHAAGELASFLKQVTGAGIEAADRAPAGGKSRLLVGPDAAKLTDPSFSTAELGAEGLILRTVGNDLILAGGRPRGTLYAVYTFLEDLVGCRWWSSKASTIPKRPTLSFDRIDVRTIPPLEYRESFWYDAFDGDFAVRNKCNGHSARLDARRGGKHIYQGFVHTFFPLIPPDKYFEKHPEWFSQIDGKRQQGRTQLCLTNDQIRQELVKNLKALLRKNPAATIA